MEEVESSCVLTTEVQDCITELETQTCNEQKTTTGASQNSETSDSSQTVGWASARTSTQGHARLPKLELRIMEIQLSNNYFGSHLSQQSITIQILQWTNLII